MGLYNTFYEQHQISFFFSLSLSHSVCLMISAAVFPPSTLCSSSALESRQLTAHSSTKHLQRRCHLQAYLATQRVLRTEGEAKRINLGDFSSLLIVLMEVKQSQHGIKGGTHWMPLCAMKMGVGGGGAKMEEHLMCMGC